MNHALNKVEYFNGFFVNISEDLSTAGYFCVGALRDIDLNLSIVLQCISKFLQVSITPIRKKSTRNFFQLTVRGLTYF